MQIHISVPFVSFQRQQTQDSQDLSEDLEMPLEVPLEAGRKEPVGPGSWWSSVGPLQEEPAESVELPKISAAAPARMPSMQRSLPSRSAGGHGMDTTDVFNKSCLEGSRLFGLARGATATSASAKSQVHLIGSAACW